MVTRAVDATRATGVLDDYSAVQFLLVTITDLAGEVESRGLIDSARAMNNRPHNDLRWAQVESGEVSR